MKNTKKIIASFFMSLTLATSIFAFSASSTQAGFSDLFDFSISGTGSSDSQSLWKNQVGMGSSNNKLGQPFGRSSTPDDIRIIIARLIKVFMQLLGIIFLALLVFAGYKYMTAQGDSKKTDDAVKSIGRAVVGLLITISAFALTSYILDALISTQEKQGYYLFK